MKSYYDSVYRVLERNTKADRVISPKHITEIFYLIIENEDLRRYVGDLYFLNTFKTKDDSTAMYCLQDRSVLMSKEGIGHLVKLMKKDTKLEGLELSLYLNECIINVLLHELEHAKQVKYLVESDEYDTKYRILQMAIIYNYIHGIRDVYGEKFILHFYGNTLKKYYGKNYRKFLKQVDGIDRNYKKFYDFDPSEINAEYESLISVAAINQDEVLSREWRKIITNYVMSIYLDKHSYLTSPLGEYIKRRNKILTLDKVSIRDLVDYSLPLEIRISLGMPIKGKEYDRLESYFKKRL